MRRLLVVFFACIVCLWVPAASAQDSSPPESPTSGEDQDADQGQGPASTFTEVMDVRVINVDVYVTDRRGDPIEGLQLQDFQLKVDGKPMDIVNFYSQNRGTRQAETLPTLERETSSTFTPIEQVGDPSRQAHVVILIDHTRLGGANRKRALNALREAMTRLDPEDRIAIVGVEDSLVFYTDFLTDRRALERTLDDIEREPPRSDLTETERRSIYNELARGQSGGFLARTANLDENAISSRIQVYAQEEFNRGLRALRLLETVSATMAGIPGRKSLLYVAEGIPTRPGEGMFVEWRNRFGQGNTDAGAGMRRIDFDNDYTRQVGNFDLTTSMEKMAEAANRANVTLYAIDAEGDHGGIIRSALTQQGSTSEAVSVVDANYRAPLEFMTQATGGRLLRSSGSLVEQLQTLTNDFESFYSLGFRPPADWDRGSEHNVEVKVKGRGRRVRHRDEIRLPKPGEREASATVSALMYQTLDNPLGIRVTMGTPVPREDGLQALPVRLEIPVGNLGLIPEAGVHKGSLEFYISTKDWEGNAGAVQKIPFSLAIPDEVIEQARGDAAFYDLPLVLRPGDQQVAIGISDQVNGAFSSVRLDVREFSGTP